MSLDHFGGCSHTARIDDDNSMNSMDESIASLLTSRSPRGTDMQNEIFPTFACDTGVPPLQHNNAFPAATQPVPPAPIQTEPASQPPVTLKEILKLKNRMKELALQVASLYSEPWGKHALSQADLDSMDALGDKKEILDDTIASLERILHMKTAPTAPLQVHAAPPQAKAAMQETAPRQAKPETPQGASD